MRKSSVTWFARPRILLPAANFTKGSLKLDFKGINITELKGTQSTILLVAPQDQIYRQS